MGPGLPVQLHLRLHRGHRRFRRRRPRPARREAGLRQGPPRQPGFQQVRRYGVPHRRERPRGGRFQQPGPDRQGAHLQDRGAYRHPAAQAAGGHLQRRSPAAADLRGRPDHLRRDRQPDPDRRPAGTRQGAQFEQHRGAVHRRRQQCRDRPVQQHVLLRRCRLQDRQGPAGAVLLRQPGRLLPAALPRPDPQLGHRPRRAEVRPALLPQRLRRRQRQCQRPCRRLRQHRLLR